MNPTITAVVVAFRSADHLPDLLRALDQQGVDEVVVVDNASPDDSADVARATLPTVRVVSLPENRGFAAGVNAGLAAATGHLLLIVNPDVRLRPGALGALRAASKRHPGAVLGPAVRDGDGRLLPTRRSLPTFGSLLGEEVLIPERAAPGGWPQRLWSRWQSYESEVDAPLLSGVCLLVPRAVWREVGPFDEGYFLYWEEIDWQLRARALGHRTVLVPGSEIEHLRSTALGLHDPRRATHMGRSTRRFLLKHLGQSRGRAALVLLSLGQLARWAIRALQALGGDQTAARRRGQHSAWLSGAWRTRLPRSAAPPVSAGTWWVIEPFGRGGVAQYARDVAGLLSGAGTVVVAGGDGASSSAGEQLERWFPRRGPAPLDRLIAAAVGLARARRRPARGDTAWVQLGFRPGWERLLVASLHQSGCRVIATVHNRSPHEHPHREPGVVAAARACDHVVVHTAAMQEWARGHGLPTTRLPFPPPAGDRVRPAGRHTRHSLRLGPDDLVLVAIGNLRGYKGIDVLLQALGRLPAASPVHVVLAGQSHGWDVVGAAAEAGAAERVRLIEGYLEHGELLDCLDLADAAVLPYRAIDHSGAGALAASRGLPAVASDLPGLRDLFGDAALYVPPGSASALAEALERLPEMLPQLRAAANAVDRSQDLSADYISFRRGFEPTGAAR